jgi:hypothetical protein
VTRDFAEREIERCRHSGDWGPRDLRHVLPYIALLQQKEGLGELKARFEGMRHPVLSAGLKLLAEGADRDEIVRQLTATADEALRRQEREFDAAIVGLAAIADGKSPREVGERLRKA